MISIGRLPSVLAQSALRLWSHVPHHRSFLIGLCSASVVGVTAIVLWGGDDSTTAEAEIALAERRDIVTSVKATGTVSFAREQQLSFNQRGQVQKVLVREGDRVTQGQVLAELDKTSIAADLRQSQLSLNTSALQLQQLQVDKERKALEAQNTVRDAERQFNDAQRSLTVTQEKLPGDLAAAERDVRQKEADLAEAEVTALQDLATTANAVLTTSEDALDDLYGILRKGTETRQSQHDKTLEIHHRLYNDISLYNTVQFDYYTATTAIDAMRSQYGDSLPSEREPKTLSKALDEASSVASAIFTLADNTYRLLQGAATDPHDFTPDDVDALKSEIVALRTSAANLVEQAKAARAAMTGRGGKIGSNIVIEAENALLKARENLQVLQSQNPADLLKQQGSVEKIQDDFKTKEASLQSTLTAIDIDIRLKQNDIAQKAAALQKASKTLDDYQIVAPFDGVIRRVDYQVGDNLLAEVGEDKAVVIENPDFIVVTTLLDQVDVVRVRQGSIATITLDAVPGRSFTGAISQIDPTPVQQSGVVSYEVAVRIPTPSDLTILSGMTATSEIELDRRSGVIAVPSLAVRRSGQGAAVRSVTGDDIPVQLGLTDGRFVEVLSGLEEHDVILAVYPVSASSSSINANAAQQLMRGLGGGGPGGGAVRTTTR